MIKTHEKDLIKKAINAMNNSYVPYSKFPVGACAVSAGGEFITGCNIENASYGLTMCAERVTLFKAYSEGIRDIKALAIAANTDDPISPCGACRQVILELARDATIYLLNRDASKIKKVTIDDLLPYSFKL